MTALSTPDDFHPRRSFSNGAEWLAALGNVPMNRIIFDPWPGTATENDLLRFCERDKRLCELIDGTLVEKPVGFWEGFVEMDLGIILGNFVNERELGAVSSASSTMRMKSGRVRLPDVGFISNARLPKTREPIPTISPDLAVEVLSESNTDAEMRQKLIEYFQTGTRLVWIVDPATRTVAIYHQPGAATRTVGENDMLDGEDVLPGLSFEVSRIFKRVQRGE